jgi:hypothetical protein
VPGGARWRPASRAGGCPRGGCPPGPPAAGNNASVRRTGIRSAAGPTGRPFEECPCPAHHPSPCSACR